MLADLLKLLAQRAREMEALRLPWRDVDFETQLLHIGRDGQTRTASRALLISTPILRPTFETCTCGRPRILLGCFRRRNEQIAKSMSIGRTPTRFGIGAGDSRVFLMLNFMISATTLPVAA
jgi:hypothetical protein